MSNLKVTSVDYDKDACTHSKTLICPYCSIENDIDPDATKTYDDMDMIQQCQNCESIMVYEKSFLDSAFYTSYPIENYYLTERKRHINHIRQINLKLDDLEEMKESVMHDQLNNKRS